MTGWAAGGQGQAAAAGQIKGGSFLAGIAVPHPQPGLGHGFRQGEGIPHPVSFAVGDHPAEGAPAAGTAEAVPHAVPVGEAFHRFFGPAQTVKPQMVQRPGHRKLQVIVIVSGQAHRPLRQADVCPADVEPGPGGLGGPGTGHIVEHQVLEGIGTVAQLRPDQAGVLPQGGEGNVRIDPVFPLQFVAQGVAGQVRRRLPHMVSTLKSDVGHIHPAAVQPGKDRKVEADSVPGCGNVRNAAVFFGIGTPGGQGQVVGFKGWLHRFLL